MKSGGALLVLVGLLVLGQVLAGGALERLGISHGGINEPSDADLVPKSNVPHDPQGRPL